MEGIEWVGQEPVVSDGAPSVGQVGWGYIKHLLKLDIAR